MQTSDPATFREQAVRLGLITSDQLEAVDAELGNVNAPLPELLRALERKNYLTPWQSSKLLKGDRDGFSLGPYRLLYKIASGSFGRVFRAVDTTSERMVAIKVLRRKWSDNQECVDRFTREGKVGMQLKHDNIVEVLALDKDRVTGQHYLVMEFIEGGNLREILTIRQKLDVKEALRIVEDAAAGLAHAYSRGVTHRDIKLTNILISSQGTAKLVDFGLAQFYVATGKNGEKTREERTLDYAGLERATGVQRGDVRSDIFFLGCVLYEILTGRAPIPMAHDKSARMSIQRFQQIPPLPPDQVQAPASVFTLVETMLSLDPMHRFQTPTQLLEAIRTARRDLNGPHDRGGETARTLFIVESDEDLQDKMRKRFKDLGYRVLISSEPTRALDRFHQQPFDALLVNAQTVGEDGRFVFQQIMADAYQKGHACAAILLLAPEQADWTRRIALTKSSAIMQHPVRFTQVRQKLDELLEAATV